MSYAATGTSVRRNQPFLTPEETQQFMPSEAELLAIDRTMNAAKRMGCYDSLRDRFALQRQINEGGGL